MTRGYLKRKKRVEKRQRARRRQHELSRRLITDLEGYLNKLFKRVVPDVRTIIDTVFDQLVNECDVAEGSSDNPIVQMAIAQSDSRDSAAISSNGSRRIGATTVM